ncbi:MAG TPA: hypothetical protein VNF99_17560 [Stellaceae bacterium]|nr:hypothetical protein [Stellaceae bacterium]
MLKMMVTPCHDASPYLGVGKYYLAADAEAETHPETLVKVTLKSPLILNERQVRMLVQKYGTDSPDSMTALSGAWTLRREVLQMGHDGIIAVAAARSDSRLTLVELAHATDREHSTSRVAGKKSGADILRLTPTEVVGVH